MSAGEALLAGLSGVLVAAALLLGAVAVRRRLLQRDGGTVDLSLRLSQASGRGWAAGVGRFAGDDLQWYRLLSLAPRPRRTFSRRDLAVVEQRPAQGEETYALQSGALVLSCRTSGGPVQLGMAPSAVTGFLAWLEATPPGATLPPA